MLDPITFYHPLRTPTATGHRVHSIKLTTLPGRSHIVRDAVDKASKPTKYKSRQRIKKQDYAFPMFTPGMTTLEYVTRYDNLQNLKPVPSQRIDSPAPMLDPTLPEMWEDIE